MQFWRIPAVQRINSEFVPLKCFQHCPDQTQDSPHIQILPNRRILAEVRFGQSEQGRRRTEPSLLQMYERAGKLDQAFVESVVRTSLLREPQLFQDIMRLEKKFAIEIIEIRKVMRIRLLPSKWLDHF